MCMPSVLYKNLKHYMYYTDHMLNTPYVSFYRCQKDMSG